jgi:hypothetical protein
VRATLPSPAAPSGPPEMATCGTSSLAGLAATQVPQGVGDSDENEGCTADDSHRLYRGHDYRRTRPDRAAEAATLCVGTGSGCYSTIQAAVNAAHDGDRIAIGPGTYAGGITVDVSVLLAGVGPATRISGGGPVVTIGSATQRSR